MCSRSERPQATSAPILLWAVTHPTLVSAEVPLLRVAGFEVVVQEPTDLLRPVELIEYPDLSLSTDADHDPRIAAARELGPRLRLGARSGLVSHTEAALVNWAFDAIMFATDFGAASSISRWFNGAVLFRDYGHIPGYTPRDRQQWRRRRSNLVGVPILSGLETTPFERCFHQVHTLGTVVPKPQESPRTTPVGHQVVSLFVGGLNSEEWLPSWLALLRETMPAGVQIRVFGASDATESVCQALGFDTVPRLADEEYRPLFASTDIWVYPHENPLHTHYIPLEAIDLGIPCIMSIHTATANESLSTLTGELQDYGIAPSVWDLPVLAARLMQSPSLRGDISAAQKVLLRPFSEDAVLAQARTLVGVVEDFSARRGIRTAHDSATDDLGPPSAMLLKSALKDSFATAVQVCASSIAIPAHVRQAPRGSAVPGAKTHDPRLTEWLVRPGPDISLPLGVLAHSAGRRMAFRIDCDVSTSGAVGILLELIDPNGSRDILTWTDQVSGERWTTLTGFVEVDPGQEVEIRVLSMLAPWGTRLGALRVTRVDETETDGHGPISLSPGISGELQARRSIPFTMAATSVPTARWVSQVTRGLFSVLRLALDQIRSADPIDDRFTVIKAPSHKISVRGLPLVLVIARNSPGERPRVLLARIGPWQVQRSTTFSRRATVIAVGTLPGIIRLAVRNETHDVLLPRAVIGNPTD